MTRLSPQTQEAWEPIADSYALAVLDRSVEEFAAATGWSWKEVEEEGLGVMFYIPLAWDGRSRFLLSASGFYPENGIAVEASRSENAAAARAELLADLQLPVEALLAIVEGDLWFARWDPPHNAGVRPPTATRR